MRVSKRPPSWRGVTNGCEFIDRLGNRIQWQLSDAQRRAAGLGDGVITVERISVDARGITLKIPGVGFLQHRPDRWAEWWSEGLGKARDNAAVWLCGQFSRWRLDQFADEALTHIRAGELGFDELHKRHPEVFAHPRIQGAYATAAEAGNPKGGRRGKRAKFPPKIYELLHWADYYRGWDEDRMSAKKACAVAIENHPELIPSNWVEDPADALYRRYIGDFQTLGTDIL